MRNLTWLYCMQPKKRHKSHCGRARVFTAYADVSDALSNKLVEHLYGDDLEWVVDGRFAGLQESNFVPVSNRG